MAQFTTDDLQIGFISDASPNSHPIVPPAQYGPFFDRITYQKVLNYLKRRILIFIIIVRFILYF